MSKLDFFLNVFPDDDKAIPWTASTSERSKTSQLNGKKMAIFPSFI
jgi:hypothetical protein